MRLTRSPVGTGTPEAKHRGKRGARKDFRIALAGNPNVGKSTVFNRLTGMNQHTGNWPGKTVSMAEGIFASGGKTYALTDLPGTYSLMAHSGEEEVARNYICFGSPDAVVAVCDATCLERNLNLVLQITELTERVVVCVNLMDEAKRKGISLDLPLLSQRLGIPVIGVEARKKKSLSALPRLLGRVMTEAPPPRRTRVSYPAAVEAAIARLEPTVRELCGERVSPRWLSLRLLDGDPSLDAELADLFGAAFLTDPRLAEAVAAARICLAEAGIAGETLKDLTVTALVGTAEHLCRGVVSHGKSGYAAFDRRMDRFLTGRATGYPVMLLFLALIFWLTIAGANVPSELLASGLFALQNRLTGLCLLIGVPAWLHGALVLGVYRVLAWVVSVMLPPMAIFFPLFTLLEDAGYLPRIAYNLDRPFRRCRACGKQALTMCMGFGCNAAGVVGCRIIDSPRERLLAILTNTFVPCNGRFPTLIALLTMFFVGSTGGFSGSLLSALLLLAVILFGILATFAVTRLLSATLLRGVPSSFTLELPPYRRPQIGSVIVRSVFDRTLFVLGRAVVVAAPAGLVIWLFANLSVGGASILSHLSSFLDPFASLLGMDGVILLAFILGFPANEIVIPIILMAYLAEGSLPDMGSLAEVRTLFTANGWTWSTAVSVMLFSLLHWPCSTTLLTIRRETGSRRWTLLAAAIPTALGIAVCMLFTLIVRLF